MSETVSLDVEIKSPIERVWHALTDPATLSKWMLFKTNDFRPVVGHKFQLRDAPGWDGYVECEVLEVDPPRRLSYTWVSPAGERTQYTTVTWTLAPTESGGTRLHLEQSGFRSDARQEIGGARYGWTHMLEQLQAVLAA